MKFFCVNTDCHYITDKFDNLEDLKNYIISIGGQIFVDSHGKTVGECPVCGSILVFDNLY